MENPFKRVKALDRETLIGQAFREAAKKVKRTEFRGSVVEKAKQKEGLRIKVAGNLVYVKLKESSRSFPNFSKMPKIYQELARILVPEEKLKKALASQIWAANKIRELQMKYYKKVSVARHTQDCRALRKEFYGRMNSFLGKIEKEMGLLRDSAPLLRRFPDIMEMPTVVIAGLPNVGKSSLLARLSGSKPKIQPYPFTTKGLMFGYSEIGFKKVQFIDTPGLLDRPMAKRSRIEKQGIVVLELIVDMIVYVFDMSETCGYTIGQQLKLYNELKETFNKPVVPVANKADIIGRKPTEKLGVEEKVIEVSCETGKGIKELKKYIKESLKYV
ncbi:MAG: NOG1 family protein [Candidatus Aenigmatarchaeota archaeon]